MREIKFRGKRVDNGAWAFGYYAKDINYHVDRSEYVDCIIDTTEGAPYEGMWFEIITETVGQFTELLDIKGKDVYEGDVSKTHYSNGAECYEEIVYRYGEFRLHRKFTDGGEYWRPLPTPSYCYSSDEIFPEWIEVIGNIYENPELLGGE